jgi:hypothetical protein
MFEHLHCQAHDIRGHMGLDIVQHHVAVCEFTHEVKGQPLATQREVLQHLTYSQEFIALQIDIFELLLRDPKGYIRGG